MNIPKIHSISKKILVALFGSFLMLFLLFHALANLCLLRSDGGEWYGAFCHFMGTNVFVKIFEILLMAFFALHIALSIWLLIGNLKARGTVKYHHKSQTRTHKASKLQVLTGILMLACIVLHFTDFYFVKQGITKGFFRVQTEELMTEEVNAILSVQQQYGMSAEDYIATNEQQLEVYRDQIDEEQLQQINDQLERLRQAIPAAQLLTEAQENDMFSPDRQWIQRIPDSTAKQVISAGYDAEPDFYHQAREKFRLPFIAIMYLLFFAIVWLHMRHAFAAAFQTLGLYNYKYGNAIEMLGIIYAWFVCLCFAVVVVFLFFA